MSSSVKLFYSYSHRDETFKDELETHLAILQREDIIEEWHDRKISPGSNWEVEINEHLTQADIILLLVSPYFLASDYCYDVETVTALEMHEKGEAVVIPIILQPCLWKIARFAKEQKLQALPEDALPITSFKNHHEGWLQVAEGILNVAQEIGARTKKQAISKHFGKSHRSKDELKELIKKFLREYERWYFSPLRIVKWGGKKSGFEVFSKESSKKIGRILSELENEEVVKKTISQRGNPIYKINS